MEDKANWTYYLTEFRVEPCALFKQHECQNHRPFTCFNWHFPNQRRRRPITYADGSFNYSPDIYCEKYDENQGICPDGDECTLLHRVAGDVERKYHLRYYKTAKCVHPTNAQGQCVKNGVHCAFAHSETPRTPIGTKHDQNETGFSTALEGEERNKTSFINEDAAWSNHDQVLSCYKTEMCRKPARLCRQGYACPFYHNSRDRRRPPALYKYRSTPCPAAKTVNEWLDADICEAADMCQYCHTRTEQQFHPEIYKSTKCNDMLEHGYCPRAIFCAFAHHDSELHAPRNPYAGSTQASPKDPGCSDAPIGFVSIMSEWNGEERYDITPINNSVPSYSSVLQKRIPTKQQGFGNQMDPEDAVSSSFPKAPMPIGNFEFQPLGPGDQRLRAHSLNMGHLDMMKRNMMLNGGGLRSMENPALVSNSSLGRSDSVVNDVNTSLATLDELALDLPPIFGDNRHASLDPFGSNYYREQQNFYRENFNDNIILPENQVQIHQDQQFPPEFQNLHEKCAFLEDLANRTRNAAEMWRHRFENEQREKEKLLGERNNLLGHIEHMKAQVMAHQRQFMGGPPPPPPPQQMTFPLSINLPRESYEGIRPSASLPHSPPYNIFETEIGTAAACPRCGHDRPRSRSDSQSSCHVCNN